jgi:ectoine hydroxylase-related dioxygenase (phytanoyl-CoA dioxygenase family)
MDKLRRRLDDDGFVVLEGALGPAEVRRLVAAVDAVAVERRKPGEALHELAFLGLDPSFIELVDHPSVLPLVVSELGANVYVYHCHLDVHPSQADDARWRWHQDGGRQNIDVESPRPRLSLKAAYFLTDVPTARYGPMWIIPGSHRRDTLERPANGSLLPPGAMPLTVAAGTAVVFDRRLWHARGANTSWSTRKALFYAYTYRWIRPRDELDLDPATLASLDPVRRQLVGGSTGTLGHWFPGEEDAPLTVM